MDDQGKDFEMAFTLIAAWGTAIEEGHNADQEFAALQEAQSQNPVLIYEAVNLAAMFKAQELKQTNSMLSQNRVTRVELLKTLLNIETHTEHHEIR